MCQYIWQSKACYLTTQYSIHDNYRLSLPVGSFIVLMLSTQPTWHTNVEIVASSSTIIVR